MESSLRGLFVPLITPFTDDGELATDALEKLAHGVIDAGAAGLVALGTTGEHATLSVAERHAVLDIAARACRERGAQLIAGAGSNDTAGSVRELRDLAAWPEVTAALTVVPYYTRPSEAGVVAHFARLAADSPVPLVVYNIPYRTGRVLSLRTLLELARVPGIAGVKHAAGTVDQDTVLLMAGLLTPAPAMANLAMPASAMPAPAMPAPATADPATTVRSGGFAVLAGDDVFASPLLALGAAGSILASAHLRTGEFAELIAAWHAGEAGRARELGHRLAPLSAALFAEPNPAVVKGVLHARGLIPSPAVRLPLLAAGKDAVRAALALC
jgi:4-hydroxy-tetrahydrodipicolinate synthase